MKNILRKFIATIRIFLDRAEAFLDETHQVSKDVHPTKNAAREEFNVQEYVPEEKELLVPFGRGNSTGAPSTYKDRKNMNSLLDEWAHVSGMDAKQAKAMLRKHAQVSRVDYMTVGQVDEACSWLRGQISNVQK